MTLLLENISFERNEKLLFSPIDCELVSGDLLQIYGTNGSGKSTLLRMIAGLIEPTTGKIYFEKKSIENHHEYQTQIHYLGHQNGIKPYLTVEENIHLNNSIARTSSENIVETLKKINLYREKNKLAKELSAGQMRRLALARLILLKKHIWILDEPLTSLDKDAQLIFSEILEQHLQNQGITIIATHQPISLNGKIIQLECAHD